MQMGITGATGKIQLLIPRLASDSDGEVIATVSAIIRVLKSNDCDLHDLAKAIGGQVKPGYQQQEKPKAKAKEPPPHQGYDFNQASENPFAHITPDQWREVVGFCEERLHDMPPRERDFIESMAEQIVTWATPTVKQAKWLMDIFRKTGGKL